MRCRSPKIQQPPLFLSVKRSKLEALEETAAMASRGRAAGTGGRRSRLVMNQPTMRAGEEGGRWS